MKKAISYLYREILLKVNEELDRLYDSEYEEDQEYKEPIEKFRVKYQALNLEDLYNFDEDKCYEFYEEIKYEEWEEIVRDMTSEFRCSGSPIDDKVYEGRYYCSREVVKRITGLCRVFLAWTYYFGGSEYSEPSEVEWMKDCYLVKDNYEIRTVRVYEKVEE